MAPESQEYRSPRFAEGRTASLPLPGGEGRGEGERWSDCFSLPTRLCSTTSRILRLRKLLPPKVGAPLPMPNSSKPFIRTDTNRSRITHHVSRITFHASRFTHHVSR